jgi:acyl-CoA thioesterase-2
VSAGIPGQAPRSDLGQSLLDVLDLETLDRDLYRGNVVYPDRSSLYGGQVAAQALLAAGRTVGDGRTPHSLHGYFLRRGDSTRPTVFRVDRDRDGRSFAARRVVALQDGEVLFTMSCSFAVPEDGPDLQADPVPDGGSPEVLPGRPMPRLFSMEARIPAQRFPAPRWPLRFWTRTTLPLPDDPLLHACVLTYVSDIGSGVSAFEGGENRSNTSIDHAVWFHRPIRLDDWVLMDLVPHTAAAARGWYTGSLHDASGRLGASLTQEVLYRERGPARS